MPLRKIAGAVVLQHDVLAASSSSVLATTSSSAPLCATSSSHHLPLGCYRAASHAVCYHSHRHTCRRWLALRSCMRACSFSVLVPSSGSSPAPESACQVAPRMPGTSRATSSLHAGAHFSRSTLQRILVHSSKLESSSSSHPDAGLCLPRGAQDGRHQSRSRLTASSSSGQDHTEEDTSASQLSVLVPSSSCSSSSTLCPTLPAMRRPGRQTPAIQQAPCTQVLSAWCAVRTHS